MAGIMKIDAAVIDEHQPDILLVRSVTPVNKLLLDNNKASNLSVVLPSASTMSMCEFLLRKRYHFAHLPGCSKHSVTQYVVAAIANLRPDIYLNSSTFGIIGWAISVIR